MRKTIAIATATSALLLGGAGVANAALAGVPASTTTTVAQNDYGNDTSDNTGLWGLAGLLGLIGLTGLKRRNDNHDMQAGNAGAMRGAGTGTTTNRGTPPPTV